MGALTHVSDTYRIHIFVHILKTKRVSSLLNFLF